MTLRLLLVSLVACLGLSLPSAERLERWGRSGQAWMNGQSVNEDGSEPLDEGRFVVIADVADAPPVAAAVASAPEAAPVEVEKVAEKVVEIPAAPAVTVSTPEVEVAPEVEVVAKVVEDDAEAKAFLADWLAAIELEAAPPADEPAPPAPAEEMAVAAAPTEQPVIEAPVIISEAGRIWWEAWLDDVTRSFVVDPAQLEELPTEAPQVAEAAPEAPKAESADEIFAGIVEETAASFAKDVEALAAKTKSEPVQTAEAPAAVPVAEPVAVSADNAKDVALDLNRQAEGLTPAAAAAMKAPAPQEDRLSHAMRLTREAVNAWASLLHGPALVTLER